MAGDPPPPKICKHENCPLETSVYDIPGEIDKVPAYIYSFSTDSKSIKKDNDEWLECD